MLGNSIFARETRFALRKYEFRTREHEFRAENSDFTLGNAISAPGSTNLALGNANFPPKTRFSCGQHDSRVREHEFCAGKAFRAPGIAFCAAEIEQKLRITNWELRRAARCRPKRTPKPTRSCQFVIVPPPASKRANLTRLAQALETGFDLGGDARKDFVETAHTVDLRHSVELIVFLDDRTVLVSCSPRRFTIFEVLVS